MTFVLAESESRANIKVIGIGGGGNNAVNTMVESKLAGVDFIAANTDLQALNNSQADIHIQLGPQKTKGWGPEPTLRLVVNQRKKVCRKSGRP